MNRAIYSASVVVAAMSVLIVVQMTGTVPNAASGVSPQSVETSSTTAVAPDSSSSPIEALAAWPVSATR